MVDKNNPDWVGSKKMIKQMTKIKRIYSGRKDIKGLLVELEELVKFYRKYPDDMKRVDLLEDLENIIARESSVLVYNVKEEK